ncbi:MAG: hypothetical protein ABSA50_07285 [Candidatus Bathyarchaeia archaeon]
MNYDYDGLNELFDKGAYHKAGPFGLKGIMAAFRRHNLEAHIPLIIGFLYALSGDYISLLRHLRMVI